MLSSNQMLSLVLVLTLISCNLEVNTVDPQTSVSEAASKRNGFFINSYSFHYSKSKLITLENAWIEYCWKKEATLWKVTKVKTHGLQLNFKVKDLSPQLDENKYLTDWRMEVDKFEVMGRSDDVYTLYLNSVKIPDSLIVQIKVKIGNDFIERDEFPVYLNK